MPRQTRPLTINVTWEVLNRLDNYAAYKKSNRSKLINEWILSLPKVKIELDQTPTEENKNEQSNN